MKIYTSGKYYIVCIRQGEQRRVLLSVCSYVVNITLYNVYSFLINIISVLHKLAAIKIA